MPDIPIWVIIWLVVLTGALVVISTLSGYAKFRKMRRRNRSKLGRPVAVTKGKPDNVVTLSGEVDEYKQVGHEIELERLNAERRRLVEEEAYEQASEIRDKITKLEDKRTKKQKR